MFLYFFRLTLMFKVAKRNREQQISRGRRKEKIELIPMFLHTRLKFRNFREKNIPTFLSSFEKEKRNKLSLYSKSFTL